MRNTEKLWVGPLRDKVQVGDFKFVLGLLDPTTDHEYRFLRDLPAYHHTNGMPILRGHCGVSKGGRVTTALGVAQVVHVAKNRRVEVEMLEGDAQTQALNELGYPELIEN